MQITHALNKCICQRGHKLYDDKNVIIKLIHPNHECTVGPMKGFKKNNNMSKHKAYGAIVWDILSLATKRSLSTSQIRPIYNL